MNFKNVTVAGGGVLGSQIAFQSAFYGFHVNVYEINHEAIEAAKLRMESLKAIYGNHFNNIQRADEALQHVTYYTDLADAVKDADLVMEAVPERVLIKESFYKRLGRVAPEKTVFTSNSTKFLPSQFAKMTGRPEKFLALHFANELWQYNTAEVMGHASTNAEYVQQVVDFARAIDTVPFVLQKEQPGYISTTLLSKFLSAAMELWVKGIADPHTIDKNWMISTGAPRGPFALYDVLGLETPYNLNVVRGEKNPLAKLVAEKIKREMIDQGKLGISTGEGFYQYPNPAYMELDFLKSN